MNVNHEQLLFKALVAVSEVVEQSRKVPVEPTASLRFILAWLYAHSHGYDRSLYDEFWRVVQSGDGDASGAYQARYIRGTSAQTLFTGIARRCGVELTVELEHQLRQARMTKEERQGCRASLQSRCLDLRRQAD